MNTAAINSYLPSIVEIAEIIIDSGLVSEVMVNGKDRKNVDLSKVVQISLWQSPISAEVEMNILTMQQDNRESV